MKFIIEAHRTKDSVEPVQYALLLDSFVSDDITSVDVYTTVNELANGNKIDTITGITFGSVDIDTRYDTYYVSLDVPDEYKSAMHEGRGAFIANIVDGKIVRLDYVQKGGQ